MGIETLLSAAHAAGFAMAGSEEMFDDAGHEDAGHEAKAAVDTQWQPGRAVLVPDAPGGRTDWFAFFLGLLGRRTPVRRPALTAGA